MTGLRDHLHRYWIRWSADARPDSRIGSGLGCGVTALDSDDAMRLVQRIAMNGDPLPPIAEIVKDVDVHELDSRHVRPNMGDSSVRGVWFPRN